jgi:hypothetical protein
MPIAAPLATGVQIMAETQKHEPGQIHRSEENQNGPETARVYERSHPSNEGGMGRLDNNKSIPEPSVDAMEQAVTHRQPSRQINADDVVDGQASQPAAGTRVGDDKSPRPDGSDIVNE